MDGAQFGSYYNHNHYAKRKKIEVTTNAAKVQPIRRQLYYQSNPYSLAKNPSTPVLHREPLSRDNSSNRDTLTQTSSQKSGKMVRANGLTKAEKPNISQSRVLSKPSMQRLTGSNVGPAISSGFHEQSRNMIIYQNHPHTGSPTQAYYSNNSIKSAMHTHLQQQNSSLKLQNIKLKEQMFKMEVAHGEEVSSLNDQIDRLFRLTKQLQQKINMQDRQWQNYLQQSSRR